MDYKHAMETLKSTRDFKDKRVPEDIIEETIAYAEQKDGLMPGQKIQVTYLKHGDTAFEELKGIVGYHGIMISAPQYLLFSCENVDYHQINVGYFVEDILLRLRAKEVDSCWISIPEDGELVKSALNLHIDGEVAALVALGYDNFEVRVVNPVPTGGNYSKSSMRVVENNRSTRLSIDEFVYKETWGQQATLDDLKGLALDKVFYYTIMAPSTYNRQPWRFLLQDNKLLLFVEHDEQINHELDLLDAGVIMCYIDILMNYFSIQGKWKLEMDNNIVDIPDKYRYIGYFS